MFENSTRKLESILKKTLMVLKVKFSSLDIRVTILLITQFV